jgi:hypothetical protein
MHNSTTSKLDIKVIYVSIRSAIWAENGWIEHNNSQRFPAKGKLKAFPGMNTRLLQST